MANLNKIILIGRLTAPPESRTTVDGLPVTRFNLVINRFLAGGATANDFFDIVAWRRLAEVCSQYLKKGQLVLIEGRIQNRSFEDQNGQKRWVTEIIARNMTMLEKSAVDSQPSSVEKNSFSEESEPEAEEAELVDDADLTSDLPF